MNRLTRRITSVRVRLTLWNTVTFAIVLISLGVGFRFLARNYLLSALDREIGSQAKTNAGDAHGQTIDGKQQLFREQYYHEAHRAGRRASASGKAA